MKNLIKNTSLVLVITFLGLFLVGCKKDNPEPQLEPRVDHSIEMHIETIIKMPHYTHLDTLHLDMEVYGEKFTKVIYGYPNRGWIVPIDLRTGFGEVLKGKPFDESKIAPIKISLRLNSDRGVGVYSSAINYKIITTKSDYNSKTDTYYNVTNEVRVLKLSFSGNGWSQSEGGIISDYEVVWDYML